jgi:hypothetical protein
MDTPEDALVAIINRLGECRKRQMHHTVAHAVDDAFDEAVEVLLRLRAAETVDID